MIDDLGAARAASQLLHRPWRRPAVVDLVRHLLAVQAQDINAAPLALRARARDLTLADVSAAREDRSVVRTWGPRGTLHLVAVEDLGWLTALTRPSAAGNLRRLTQEGVTGTEAELVRRTARALEGQGPLSKVELGRRVKATGQAIVHLAALAALHGLVVLGPDRGGKPTYVHTGDWLGRPVDLTVDRAAAAAELARRYLRARAPAGPDDLAAWSGLPLTACRAAFADLAPPNPPPARRAFVRLLPAFDEYLLGWRDRSAILDPAHARAVAPGGGIIRPTIVANGRIVGTWRGGPVSELFDECDERALSDEAADIRRFLG